MESYGWLVEQNNFTDSTPYGVKKFANIVASLPIGTNYNGVNSQSPNYLSNFHIKNRIVFACHYDSKYETDFEFLGAIDSAVPCAMLLDMAKFLKENFDQKQFSKVILRKF